MDKINFFSKQHYKEIREWFKGHGLDAPEFEMLPPNGYIMPGVAAGFLYMTDSPISFLDCFISNPNTDEKERDSALDWIAMHLTNCARVNGTKVLICNTMLPVIKDRAVKLGFTEMGKHYSLAKELS